MEDQQYLEIGDNVKANKVDDNPEIGGKPRTSNTEGYVEIGGKSEACDPDGYVEIGGGQTSYNSRIDPPRQEDEEEGEEEESEDEAVEGLVVAVSSTSVRRASMQMAPVSKSQAQAPSNTSQHSTGRRAIAERVRQIALQRVNGSLGIVLMTDDRNVRSPAYIKEIRAPHVREAGLLVGDRIVSVKGVSVVDMHYADLKALFASTGNDIFTIDVVYDFVNMPKAPVATGNRVGLSETVCPLSCFA